MLFQHDILEVHLFCLCWTTWTKWYTLAICREMEGYFGHRTTHFPAGKRCSQTGGGGLATEFQGLVRWTR
jgi:hypothetical protein